MKKNQIESVILIGAGNVAWHIAKLISETDIELIQVFNRNLQKAKEVASLCDSESTDMPEKILTSADLYIICISDDYIADVLPWLGNVQGILAHTAGAVSMDILNTYSDKIGVLYPYQTLTRKKPLLSNEIPLVIEANTKDTLISLRTFAERLSDKVYEMSGQQREKLHLAGVITNNFMNHLMGQSKILLENSGIPYNLMYPLINETLSKAKEYDPLEIQTGPAVRNNQKIIQKHLKLLSKNKSLMKIYEAISENISLQHADKSQT